MNVIDILSQIPKLNKDTLIAAPQIEATKKDVYDYLTESGIVIEVNHVENIMEKSKRLFEYCQKLHINICNIQDENYSKELKMINNPPALLYYRGDISKLNLLKIVAVIGTRKPSSDGEKISYNLGNVLSKKGYGVINGLALGCDTWALKGSMSANVSYPIAVVSGGVNEIYPKENRKLAEDILEKGGCIISEYPPDTEIKRYMYVQRDRIQAGLSNGIIIVEAMESSGTMHTVNYAKKYNRPIACYKEKNNVFTGNKKLIESGVLSLENDDDLRTFENSIRKNSLHQISFFE